MQVFFAFFYKKYLLEILEEVFYKNFGKI